MQSLTNPNSSPRANGRAHRRGSRWSNAKFLVLFLSFATLLGGVALVAPQFQQKANAAIDPTRINYTISGGETGQSSYSDALTRLRQRVTGGRFLQGDTLRTNPDARNDFTMVHIGAGNEGTTASEIQLLIRHSDLFVVGWHNRNDNIFTALEADIPAYEDPDPIRSAPPGLTRQVRARFNGSYGSLEGRSASRRDIALSPDAVRQAVRDLSRSSSTEAQQARALIVLIQVIAEGARFRPVENLYRGTYTGAATAPPPAILALENAWDPMSEIANRHVNNPNDPLTQELLRRHENFLRDLEVFEARHVLVLLLAVAIFTPLK
ncbi:ribosome-inactivating family protein [Streptomyces sp. NPDC060065]|uniref:ribosome-inactivating family protein n=1 Tax=Streptomyces sp. NPDC060065 TaxID=3347050 RepID=UPI0036A3ED93